MNRLRQNDTTTWTWQNNINNNIASCCQPPCADRVDVVVVVVVVVGFNVLMWPNTCQIWNFKKSHQKNNIASVIKFQNQSWCVYVLSVRDLVSHQFAWWVLDQTKWVASNYLRFQNHSTFRNKLHESYKQVIDQWFRINVNDEWSFMIIINYHVMNDVHSGWACHSVIFSNAHGFNRQQSKKISWH